jgi:4-hydroxy-3-polyprenylbenzoate decarboxylase
VLARFDPTRDLHFQTRTTIDTLDYSAGMGLNAGSKLVIAAAGLKRRELATEVPSGLRLPDGFSEPRIVMPGVLAVCGPRFQAEDPGDTHPDISRFCAQLETRNLEPGTFPLVTVVDDSDFVCRKLDNWLWATFTRSDPANDVWGVEPFVNRKHWGCRGPLVIDARMKPHMPPPLEEDPGVTKRIDRLFARGGPLAGVE